ncbi:MAG TPA: hypothetical protein VJM46_03510 [Candidatus Saccharimonadales bacterium]|nr:hypothetical protein [Candidatus Saccharimonadales bacterium]
MLIYINCLIIPLFEIRLHLEHPDENQYDGLARVRDEQGRLALLVNKGRLTRNQGRILSPIGGAFEYNQAGRRHLERLGAIDFEGDKHSPVVPDLRFRVPDNKVNDVITWFQTRRQRERTVLRELTEELTTETGLLTPDTLRIVSEAYSGFFRFDARTMRDVPERTTVYLMEIFDVVLAPATMRRLLAAASGPPNRRWIHFVTPAELARGTGGRTDDGIEIGQISQFIV